MANCYQRNGHSILCLLQLAVVVFLLPPYDFLGPKILSFWQNVVQHESPAMNTIIDIKYQVHASQFKCDPVFVFQETEILELMRKSGMSLDYRK